MEVSASGIAVLWRDEQLLAINKPPGLRTLPDGYDPDAPHVRRALEGEYGRLWIVHRLDKETSGVLLLARSAAAHRQLNGQFDAHTPRKVYHALAAGAPPWEQFTFDAPLKPDGDRRHRTLPHPQGKAALTHVRVLERFAGAALLEARPETGRTHQIRAHLGFAGFPLLSDELYGGAPSAWIGRCALHAQAISFLHPASLQPLTLAAPYPEDWLEALRRLRGNH